MHPSTQHVLQFFEFDHLPDHLKPISGDCCNLAHSMVAQLPENAELTAGLRKLLEAKDCFVRAKIAKAPEGE